MATGDTREKAAEDFGLTDIPDGWRPEPGDLVIGQILAMTTGWSDEKEGYYPIIVIDDEVSGKPVSVHAFHAALVDRLTRLKPKVGERIGIRMGEKIPLKSNPNRSVQTYTVKVEGRSEDIWETIKTPIRSPKETGQETLDVEESVTSDDDIPF